MHTDTDVLISYFNFLDRFGFALIKAEDKTFYSELHFDSKNYAIFICLETYSIYPQNDSKMTIEIIDKKSGQNIYSKDRLHNLFDANIDKARIDIDKNLNDRFLLKNARELYMFLEYRAEVRGEN